MISIRFDKDVRGLSIGNELTGFSLTLTTRPKFHWSFYLYGTAWLAGYDHQSKFVGGWGIGMSLFAWLKDRIHCKHEAWRRDQLWDNFAGTRRTAWRCDKCAKLVYRFRYQNPDVVIIG